MPDLMLTVSQAETRLAEVETAVAAGEAGADALGQARQNLEAAKLRADQLAEVTALRERRENLDAIAVEIGWLEGDDVAELVRRYVRAHRAAVAALAEARFAWSDLAGEWHRHMRRVRALAESADVWPDGVTVSPLMGRDVEVSTVHGTWNSASGLRADHVAAIVETSRDVANGRAPRGDLLGRLSRWYLRGTGRPLEDDDGGGLPPAA